NRTGEDQVRGSPRCGIRSGLCRLGIKTRSPLSRPPVRFSREQTLVAPAGQAAFFRKMATVMMALALCGMVIGHSAPLFFARLDKLRRRSSQSSRRPLFLNHSERVQTRQISLLLSNLYFGHSSDTVISCGRTAFRVAAIALAVSVSGVAFASGVGATGSAHNHNSNTRFSISCLRGQTGRHYSRSPLLKPHVPLLAGADIGRTRWPSSCFLFAKGRATRGLC